MHIQNGIQTAIMHTQCNNCSTQSPSTSENSYKWHSTKQFLLENVASFLTTRGTAQLYKNAYRQVFVHLSLHWPWQPDPSACLVLNLSTLALARPLFQPQPRLRLWFALRLSVVYPWDASPLCGHICNDYYYVLPYIILHHKFVHSNRQCQQQVTSSILHSSNSH